MNNLNKKLYVTLSSLILIGLTSCTSSTNKNSTSSENTEKNTYVGTRTISKDDNVNVLNENHSSNNTYDYTHGVSTYSPIGEIAQNEEIPTETPSNKEQQNEQLFTLQDVQQITNELSNEYNSYLEINSNEYEKYINDLANDYTSLESEYINLLNDLSNSIDKPENNISPEDNTNNIENNSNNTTSNKDESEEKKPEYVPQTREEEINSIYNKALETASQNLDYFEPIQGQAPDKNNTQNNTSNNTTQNNESEKITAENIFKLISENVSLPKYTNKDINFLTSNYNLTSNNVNDFKLVSSDSSTGNLFEMLIIKTSNISEEDLINKIQSRVTSILNNISENTNTNLNDKLLLINVDDYVMFCFSDINNDILNFLENI